MRGLFNLDGLQGRYHALPFQSALRMRGLFNLSLVIAGPEDERVSIRLADAWPFQPMLMAMATS